MFVCVCYVCVTCLSGCKLLYDRSDLSINISRIALYISQNCQQGNVHILFINPYIHSQLQALYNEI